MVALTRLHPPGSPYRQPATVGATAFIRFPLRHASQCAYKTIWLSVSLDRPHGLVARWVIGIQLLAVLQQLARCIQALQLCGGEVGEVAEGSGASDAGIEARDAELAVASCCTANTPRPASRLRSSAILRAMHANARLLHLFERFGTALQVDAQQTLVHAGDVAQAVFLLRSGAARLCLLDEDGSDTTVQFFFEGDMVSSLESMMRGTRSSLELRTMEPCSVLVLPRDTVLAQVQADTALLTELLALTQARLVDYIRLYTSAISQSPTQRYQALQAQQAQQLARIPLHILASYLGVTPVHLSRIRRTLKAKP
jgi:CRP-like cAMP-binding protein